MSGYDPSSAAAEQLKKIPTCVIVDILPEYRVGDMMIRGTRSIQFGDVPIAGPARTMRFVPSRFDIAQHASPPRNFALIDAIRPGEVLVIDSTGSAESAVLGDMLAMRASYLHGAAVVTDGLVRDLNGLEGTGLPIYAAGTTCLSFRGKSIPWESDIAVQCGGALVLPGDWIVADRDAVLALPQSLVPIILERAERALCEEDFSRQLLVSGRTLSSSYPIGAELRSAFERFLAAGSLPAD